MFLDNTLQIGGGTTSRFDYIESSGPEDMQRRFGEYMTALIAENVVRTTAQLDPLNVSDVSLSGGGDGDSFVLCILVSTGTDAQGWADGTLDTVQSAFWMASESEALRLAAVPALASISADTLSNIAIGSAGASQGTRFMAFVAGNVGGG